ncbi:hypothetical protein HIV01_015355 [Lysobacter arenosi]|uniref:Uncharacterized protein n=1 Tax=Lysobacter arenosi TaxID=2795387 RepID=A0ABX7RB01_9GAMM|nr:hypothetical protein [Lysobacter arenosi]QSX74539.1 hypothetical protein HIV01_015355 [Lysobacter arenosi]
MATLDLLDAGQRYKRNHVLEHLADGLFLFCLVVSTIATGYIAWVVSEFQHRVLAEGPETGRETPRRRRPTR